MNGTKDWWQSKTVWGSIIALSAEAARLAGVKLDATLQDQLAELLTGTGNLIGGSLAWYGRFKATQALWLSVKP